MLEFPYSLALLLFFYTSDLIDEVHQYLDAIYNLHNMSNSEYSLELFEGHLIDTLR